MAVVTAHPLELVVAGLLAAVVMVVMELPVGVAARRTPARVEVDHKLELVVVMELPEGVAARRRPGRVEVDHTLAVVMAAPLVQAPMELVVEQQVVGLVMYLEMAVAQVAGLMAHPALEMAVAVVVGSRTSLLEAASQKVMLAGASRILEALMAGRLAIFLHRMDGHIRGVRCGTGSSMRAMVFVWTTH